MSLFTVLAESVRIAAAQAGKWMWMMILLNFIAMFLQRFLWVLASVRNSTRMRKVSNFT